MTGRVVLQGKRPSLDAPTALDVARRLAWGPFTVSGLVYPVQIAYHYELDLGDVQASPAWLTDEWYVFVDGLCWNPDRTGREEPEGEDGRERVETDPPREKTTPPAREDRSKDVELRDERGVPDPIATPPPGQPLKLHSESAGSAFEAPAR